MAENSNDPDQLASGSQLIWIHTVFKRRYRTIKHQHSPLIMLNVVIELVYEILVIMAM